MMAQTAATQRWGRLLRPQAKGEWGREDGTLDPLRSGTALCWRKAAALKPTTQYIPPQMCLTFPHSFFVPVSCYLSNPSLGSENLVPVTMSKAQCKLNLGSCDWNRDPNSYLYFLWKSHFKFQRTGGKAHPLWENQTLQ